MVFLAETGARMVHSSPLLFSSLLQEYLPRITQRTIDRRPVRSVGKRATPNTPGRRAFSAYELSRRCAHFWGLGELLKDRKFSSWGSADFTLPLPLLLLSDRFCLVASWSAMRSSGSIAKTASSSSCAARSSRQRCRIRSRAVIC
jgi:hypothetical protein